MLPEVFSAQVEALAEAGCTGISLDDYAAARLGQRLIPPRAVVLTFDDGFADFASEAAPLLIRRGWSATVFLPTGKLGGCDDWEPHDAAFPPRALMNWPQIEELASGGIDFGGHSVTHCDLTRLSAQALEAEVVGSQRAIEERIGRPASTFAVPFGKTAHACKPSSASDSSRPSAPGFRGQRPRRTCTIYLESKCGTFATRAARAPISRVGRKLTCSSVGHCAMCAGHCRERLTRHCRGPWHES